MFWVIVAICIFVFAVVAAVSIYSGVKFRVKPDDDVGRPADPRAHRPRDRWTAIPTICVTVIAVLSAVVLAENDRSKGKPLRVEVTRAAVRLAVHVPEEGGLKTHEPVLVESTGRQARTEGAATSSTPSGCRSSARSRTPCRGSYDAPRSRRRRSGDYRLICTELCGLGHALMRTRAIVLRARRRLASVGARRAADQGAGGMPG